MFLRDCFWLQCSALRCVYICIGGDEALLQPHDLRQVVGLAHSLLGDPTDALAARRRAPAGGGRPVLQLSSKRGGTGGAGSRDWSNTRTRAPGEKASGGSSGRDWAAARSEQTPTKTKPSGSPDEESGGSGGEGYSSGGGGRGGGGRRTAEALSRVRYHALLLLQAVARCGSLRNQMYEHWKSLRKKHSTTLYHTATRVELPVRLPVPGKPLLSSDLRDCLCLQCRQRSPRPWR